MKRSLYTYLKEEIFATPSTTLGMGNVNIPSEPNITGGSGDIPNCGNPPQKKKKKFKRYKII